MDSLKNQQGIKKVKCASLALRQWSDGGNQDRCLPAELD